MSANRPSTRSRRLPPTFLNLPQPETNSESEESIVEDLEVGPEVTSQDIEIPPVNLPPGVEVTSYSAMVHHLKQSRFIFDAFQNKFSMIPYCTCSN